MEYGSILSMSLSYHCHHRHNIMLCSHFFQILEDISPFWPLIPLFWTSVTSPLEFQNQSGQPYLHLAEAYMLHIPQVSPLVAPDDLLATSMTAKPIIRASMHWWGSKLGSIVLQTNALLTELCRPGMLCSRLTSAFALTSPSTFNIASMVTQTQMQGPILCSNVFIVIDTMLNCDAKADVSVNRPLNAHGDFNDHGHDGVTCKQTLKLFEHSFKRTSLSYCYSLKV